MTDLISRIKVAEGEKRDVTGMHIPYRDHLGKLTIGWGTLIEDGITDDEAEFLLKNRLDVAAITACEFAGENQGGRIPDPRLNIITEMAYQMGRPRLFGFKRMREAFLEGNFEKAADEMLDSKWAKQTPRRAEEAAVIMISGKY